MSRLSALLVTSCIAAAAAQTTIRAFIPLHTAFIDPLEGSVVGTNGETTTVELSPKCFEEAQDVSDDRFLDVRDCVLLEGQTLTVAPSSIEYAFVYQNDELRLNQDYTMTEGWNCDLDPDRYLAECTMRLSGVIEGKPSVTSATISTHMYPRYEVTITITAGEDKVDKTGAITTSASSTLASETSAPGTTDGSDDATETPASRTETAASTSQTDNAAPGVTQRAYLAGAIAIAGGAAILI